MAQAHNAYMPGYAAPQVKHHEWRTAENSAAYLLPILQTTVKANPDLKLLDVGAGSGTISASLAKYIPCGAVTATDISDDILERAGEHAKEQGVTNITFQSANIYKLPFEDNTFDIVHASMVLSHLDSPVQAYKEMLRVVKPGGIVANRESDLRMWSFFPESAGIKQFHDVLLATTIEAGGNISAGAHLMTWAMQAGAKREQITATMGTWMYSTPEERRMWGGTMAERIKKGGMRDKALQMGIATEADCENMAQAWEKWQAAEDACHGSLHGEILIRK
ncbi:hypothetical protein LTR56_010438 [Elasticomyces elasticus]|nr:hypothetical protein LTR56_010438 [Elasticomyces elasticus]KAK3648470.1 hypothetical protein LTR22_013362 [Elasticomyces elasticus]KAK4916779.1 hypothetical protein LTR49_015223 [Elasticomyces elasticus]KAK5755929.1 hypothetical protein LTS12_013933 [Elasticomyces elasticus]